MIHARDWKETRTRCGVISASDRTVQPGQALMDDSPAIDCPACLATFPLPSGQTVTASAPENAEALDSGTPRRDAVELVGRVGRALRHLKRAERQLRLADGLAQGRFVRFGRLCVATQETRRELRETLQALVDNCRGIGSLLELAEEQLRRGSPS